MLVDAGQHGSTDPFFVIRFSPNCSTFDATGS